MIDDCELKSQTNSYHTDEKYEFQTMIGNTTVIIKYFVIYGDQF